MHVAVVDKTKPSNARPQFGSPTLALLCSAFIACSWEPFIASLDFNRISNGIVKREFRS
jgi:hypothetical protein